MRLTGVRIETDDVAAASSRYRALLGVEALGAETGVRFQLERGAVELVAGEPGRATVLFARDAPDDAWPSGADGFHGLGLGIEEAPPPAPSRTVAPVAATAIDHVVVFTPDPGRAIALWRDRVGMRLAFDREFPERQVRLMFFRSGGLTFEFACALPAPEGATDPDRFYGISYRVPDLAARRTALLAAGFDVSEIRPGNKAGTHVASVRDGTAGVPTLLLQAEPRP